MSNLAKTDDVGGLLPKKQNYTDYLPHTLKEAYIQAIEDPDKMDLSEELGLLRGMLKAYIKQLGQDGEIDFNVIKGTTTLIDKIGKIHQAISTHEAKMREHIPVKMMPFLIQGICGIIKSEVEDDQIAARISERIGNMPIVLERSVKSDIIDAK